MAKVKAHNTRDLPSVIEATTRRAKGQVTPDGYSGKSFNELTADDKDTLLKTLLVRAGLIKA